MEQAPPPPQYAQYPRQNPMGNLSAAKLQALGEAYYGTNKAFIYTLLVSVGILALQAALMSGSSGLLNVLAFVVRLVVVPVCAALFMRPNAEKAAIGMDWPRSKVITACVLIAVGMVMCVGILGFIVFQMIVSTKMKEYGLRNRFLGISKNDWKEAVARLAAAEAQPNPAV